MDRTLLRNPIALILKLIVKTSKRRNFNFRPSSISFGFDGLSKGRGPFNLRKLWLN